MNIPWTGEQEFQLQNGPVLLGGLIAPPHLGASWRIPVSKCFMIHNIHNIKLSQEHILYISGHFTVLLPGSKRICIQPSRIFPMTWSSTGVARVALCGTPTRQIEGRGPRWPTDSSACVPNEFAKTHHYWRLNPHFQTHLNWKFGSV